MNVEFDVEFIVAKLKDTLELFKFELVPDVPKIQFTFKKNVTATLEYSEINNAFYYEISNRQKTEFGLIDYTKIGIKNE